MENKVEIYRANDNSIELTVTLDGDTVWLNRQQLSVLLGRDVKTIGKHISNIYKEGELTKNSTIAKFATVQQEGKREVEREIDFYNLDVIISLGYLVKSKKGVHLLYFIVKNHPFNDGNKRSGAFAFIWLLQKANYDFTNKISPETLTTLTLLIATSLPEEKEKMIGLVLLLLNN
ncbi:virulence RhuM family protein [Polaribacter batillariae]|uniref:Virulence RhuM family protein n=1 Tax=Polaribacter batillariae TaxID=2808900 RepID=A0ABX7SV35_9FLAO|nr:RhuM family protein [Polaribacter batillariae]QTD38036.1 virulence RhuM family protein [Polaribacter batillariae]